MSDEEDALSTEEASPHFDAHVYPIFFVIKTENGPSLSEMNGFTVARSLFGFLGHRDAIVTKLRDGSLLVKASSKLDSEKLSSLKHVAGKPIFSLPHEKLNSSQGTVFCETMLQYSPDYLLKNLRSEHVIAIHRFSRKENGKLVETPRHLLTFDTPQPPTYIRVGYMLRSVRLFIPKPRRCYNCQSFSHPKKYCPSTLPVCVVCGQKGHKAPCSNPPYCVNCSGAHDAASPSCSKYSIAKAVRAFCAQEKLSIREAKRRVNNLLAKSLEASQQSANNKVHATTQTPGSQQFNQVRKLPVHTESDKVHRPLRTEVCTASSLDPSTVRENPNSSVKNTGMRESSEKWNPKKKGSKRRRLRR